MISALIQRIRRVRLQELDDQVSGTAAQIDPDSFFFGKIVVGDNLPGKRAVNRCQSISYGFDKIQCIFAGVLAQGTPGA